MYVCTSVSYFVCISTFARELCACLCVCVCVSVRILAYHFVLLVCSLCLWWARKEGEREGEEGRTTGCSFVLCE